MNKLYFASVALGALMLAAPAGAHDATGCGLGSMAWRGDSGVVPQLGAVITNTLTGTQTFGISSGTSGCDPNGYITGGTQRMVYNFIENNMEQYALDAAKGEGETIATIAGILNLDEAKVAEASQQHFAELFPNQDADAVYVTVKLLEVLKA